MTIISKGRIFGLAGMLILGSVLGFLLTYHKAPSAEADPAAPSADATADSLPATAPTPTDPSPTEHPEPADEPATAISDGIAEAPPPSLPPIPMDDAASTDRDFAADARATLALTSAPQRHEALAKVLKAWAEADIASAAEWLFSLPDSDPNKGPAIATILGQLFQYNEEGTRNAVLQLPNDGIKNQSLLSMARWWSRGNPAAALEWIATLNPPQVDEHVRNEAYDSAFQNLSGSDPAAAAALVFDMPAENRWNSPLKALLEHWLAADPSAAFDWIKGLPKEQRAQAIQELPGLVQHADYGLPYERLNPALRNSGLAPEMVLRFFISLPSDEINDGTLAQAVQHWAYQDLDSAMDWLDRLPQDRQSPALMTSVLQPIHELAPELALDWLNSIPEYQNTPQAMRQYVHGFIQAGDLKQSLELLFTLPKDLRKGLINSVVSQCAPERNMALIEALPPEQKQELMPALIGHWKQTDPELAREQIAKLQSGELKAAAINEVLSGTWRRDNPEDTLQWIADTFDPADFEHIKTLHLSYNVRNWWLRDKKAATAWVKGLRKSGMKDHALGGIVLAMLQSVSDPTEAQSMLKRIKDDNVRHKVAEQAIQNIMSQDPSLAWEWIDASDLAPERKARLLMPSLYPPDMSQFR